MKRHAKRPIGESVVYTSPQTTCPDCGRSLAVYQNDGRWVQGLDVMFRMIRRDKRCGPNCRGPRPIWYAPRDLRVVLPRRIYGLEVTLYVGEHHVLGGLSLSQITRDLNQRGVPLDQRHTGRVFRDFLALAQLARGDDAALRTRLRAQGGIVLMFDGVYFDERSPVLYLAWDAVSGEPLFGERKVYRGEDDLVPLLERVRAMDVPVIGVVTDKEKGLVPAVERVFPGVPYQYCKTHFLKNCAKPLAADLTALQASVRRRADAVREIGKLIASSEPAEEPASATTKSETPTTDPPMAAPTIEAATPAAEIATTKSNDGVPDDVVREVDLVQEICELVRVNSHMSGKAPLDPPELKRHERLEALREVVNEAREKKLRRRRGRVALA